MGEGWEQNSRSTSSHFLGFVEAHGTNKFWRFDEFGVGGVEAGQCFPDHDFAGAHCSGKQRCGEIGTFAAHRGRNAIERCAGKTLYQHDKTFTKLGQDQRFGTRSYLLEDRRGMTEIFIGDDNAPGIDETNGELAVAQHRFDERDCEIVHRRREWRRGYEGKARGQ